MNRKHTADDYRRVIDRFRAARQDIAFSSDFIVGFPGETEGEFAATLALVMQIGYAGGLFVQIFASARHAGGGHAGDGVSG